jgi:membrane protein implicated in regulation of membrane protease activity
VFTFESNAVAWVVLAIVAAVLEITIPQFGVIFVSLAAIPAALAAAAGLNLVAQMVVFLVVLVLSLTLLRPRLMARLGGAKGVPSRTEALIGREGVVTHDIETVVGAGRVNVQGQDWAARSVQPISAGTRIRVVGADGIVLEVLPT